MKELSKSNINYNSFKYGQLVIKLKGLRRKYIVAGWVDGQRLYFLEQRDYADRLIQSDSFRSLNKAKAAA